MRLRFFELQKVSLENDSLSQYDLKHLWLYLFNAKTTKDLDMLRDTQNPDIVTACDMLQSLSEEEKAWNAQWAREKELHDMASLLSDSREEGKEEGWNEGRESILNKLRMQGFSEAFIEKLLRMPDKYDA